MRKFSKKFKLLNVSESRNIKGGTSPNGKAKGWNHPGMFGTANYDRALDKELVDAPCPPPEPDGNE